MANFTNVVPKCKQCSVPCVSSVIELQQLSERSQIKLTEEAKKDLLYIMLEKLGPSKAQKLISQFVDKEELEWTDDYEVESILDNRRDAQDGRMYYLIKWFGWGHEHNTWEPEQNLHCEELLKEYRQTKNGRSRKRKIILDSNQVQSGLRKRRIDELFQKLLESKILDKLSPLDIIQANHSDNNNGPLNGLLTFLQPRQLRKKKVSRKFLRQEAERALQAWERELNDIIKGYDPASITVENTVDLEGPPENFIYINERKEGPGVIIPKDPLIGCDCQDCYQDRNSCCVVASGSVLAYYKSNRRLRVPRGVPIYECNIRCKCGPDCLNRVAQKGRWIKICIFRTPNGRGWGVKSLQKIKKGTFVMEYVGEVVTNEEAERRGKEYDAVGRTYLFDLDFHDADADAPFAVDAGTYGNAAHFINHSCNPNLQVHVVWINTLDPQLPHICLYAKRDIAKDEELTFDYMSGNLSQEKLPGNEHEDSSLECQTGTAFTDHDVSLTKGAESWSSDTEATSSTEATGSSCTEIKVLRHSKRQFTVKEKSNSLAQKRTRTNGVGDRHLNGIIPHKINYLQSSETECAANKKINGETPKFSMACLCGATNCRKFLFF